MSPAIKVLCKAPVGDNFNHSYNLHSQRVHRVSQKTERSKISDGGLEILHLQYGHLLIERGAHSITLHKLYVCAYIWLLGIMSYK